MLRTVRRWLLPGYVPEAAWDRLTSTVHYGTVESNLENRKRSRKQGTSVETLW